LCSACYKLILKIEWKIENLCSEQKHHLSV
jgi:hypothetical protein